MRVQFHLGARATAVAHRARRQGLQRCSFPPHADHTAAEEMSAADASAAPDGDEPMVAAVPCPLAAADAEAAGPRGPRLGLPGWAASYRYLRRRPDGSCRSEGRLLLGSVYQAGSRSYAHRVSFSPGPGSNWSSWHGEWHLDSRIPGIIASS